MTKDEEIAELKARLAHANQCVMALGKVLEDFSHLVLLCCDKINRSRGVMGDVRNPWGQ